MKKIHLVLLVLLALALFNYCSSTRRATTSEPQVSFHNDIHPLVITHCSPCHVPGKGGKITSLVDYGSAIKVADTIIARIRLHPGQKGFMPMKGTRLSDSTIQVFVRWKQDGLRE